VNFGFAETCLSLATFLLTYDSKAPSSSVPFSSASKTTVPLNSGAILASVLSGFLENALSRRSVTERYLLSIPSGFAKVISPLLSDSYTAEMFSYSSNYA